MTVPKLIIMFDRLKISFKRHCPMGLAKDTCWPWSGSIDRDGYGVFTVNKKEYRAGRISYMLHHNLISFDLSALHTCDNPPCVNPYHLFAGDHLANIKDKVKKGRQLIGAKHGQSKLNEEMVLQIKKKLYYGCDQKKLAEELGINPALITLIKRREIWIHVKDYFPE